MQYEVFDLDIFCFFFSGGFILVSLSPSLEMSICQLGIGQSLHLTWQGEPVFADMVEPGGIVVDPDPICFPVT
jgi:hypothetical protein